MTSSDRKAALMPETKHTGTVTRNAYGKSRVRLTKVTREGDRHDLKELSVDILLEGDFLDTYVSGDNTKVVATDSMKNTVYILAAEHPLKNIETFARDLAAHFVGSYSHVKSARVSIEEELWQRIVVDEKPHAHAFTGAGAEKRTTTVEHGRDSYSIVSGISNLRVVKTTNSAFEGFIRDKFTSLPDTKDRIFGTSVSATWLYDRGIEDFDAAYGAVHNAVLEIFAKNMSLSVQQTLHEIGQEAIARCEFIKEISLTMPNEHRIPFSVQKFGLENRSEISITTSEPYGLITATITRI